MYTQKQLPKQFRYSPVDYTTLVPRMCRPQNPQEYANSTTDKLAQRNDDTCQMGRQGAGSWLTRILSNETHNTPEENRTLEKFYNLTHRKLDILLRRVIPDQTPRHPNPFNIFPFAFTIYMNPVQFGFLKPKIFLVKGFFSKFNFGKLFEQSENVLEKFKKFLCLENPRGTLEWLDNFDWNKNYQFENREFLISDVELETLCRQRGYNFSVKSELEELDVPTYVLKQKWGINLLESFKIDRKPKASKNEIDSSLKMIPTPENLDIDIETPPKEEKSKIEEQDDVSAWHEVFTRTVQHIKDVGEFVSKLSNDKNEPKVKFSILPEPPGPRADIAIVRSADDFKRLTALKNILVSENFIHQHSPQPRILVHEFFRGPIKSRNSEHFGTRRVCVTTCPELNHTSSIILQIGDTRNLDESSEIIRRAYVFHVWTNQEQRRISDFGGLVPRVSY
ncbi:hypothetical protein KQX54_004496 [Cotesia glomerata]|uniref:Uncharacterized protein n=1 Tax=Cotesia glomerata TaxID=32391 RepID=A0AAV7HXQ2_COTGL|nr:hypothetical protein KQX54_004496 [Cotesia glomerata]